MRAIVEAPSLKDGSGKELRRLHDTVNQHLRALKAMGCEPSGPFVTSMLELKLDTTTMFEWRKHSQESTSVPHFTALLDFVNLRAQASESTAPEFGKKHQSGGMLLRKTHPPRSVTSLTSSVDDSCLVCKTGKHPLYSCQKFKSFPHDQMISTLKANGICLNCLRPGHFVKRCTSSQRCRRCQKPHHTLLHVEVQPETHNPPPASSTPVSTATPNPPPAVPTNLHSHSHVAQGSVRSRQPLLMTCRILVSSPDGFTTQARAMLDSASSSCFVSERLAQHLRLPRSRRLVQITGIGGVSHSSVNQSVSHFRISPIWRGDGESMEVEAIVLPKVTSDIPVHPVSYASDWHHLSGIQLADPDFGTPGSVDVLLGVDVFTSVLLHGRRHGPSGSPVALETRFGWVLAGGMKPDQAPTQVTANHASVLTGDDLLRKFWEIEELEAGHPTLSIEEKSVMNHFENTHRRDDSGRFIIPLPMRSHARPLGESRSLAVRRFLSLERSMRAKQQFQDFAAVMGEYFDMGHAEAVPDSDLDKPCDRVFYLPMHAVRKDSSSTTKVCAVFDASAKSSSGISLNDQLLVGPTVHSSLVDVLLRFRLNRIALTADVSRMYRAVLLTKEQRDLHRFVWRSQPDEILKDYRMTRITFGVAASSFAANMAVRQNAVEHAEELPLAASAVFESFYVDDGLVGADSVEGAVNLQKQLQELFSCGGFLLRKWKSSDPVVLQDLDTSLLDSEAAQTIRNRDSFSKTLGLEWSPQLDSFRLTVAEMPHFAVHTKRALVSDVAKTFDALGWFGPTVIVVKILLQRLWEAGVGWDDPVPEDICDSWKKWRLELPVLSDKLIPRCYFPKDAHVVSLQLHGFCDASEHAYAAVVYARLVDSSQAIHVSLVMAKTKVAPLKRLTIPRLELCGANLLANLLHHVKLTLHVPSDNIYAWTDSTIVLSWLSGSPRRFKPFVGNRVSNIMELIPPDRWSHVKSANNPADCASRGLFPSELLTHMLWWDGPPWLRLTETAWPVRPVLAPDSDPAEEKVSMLTVLGTPSALPIIDSVSNFTRLIRVTSWVFRFVDNCRGGSSRKPLSVDELTRAERYWITVAQRSVFSEEISCITKNRELPEKGCLVPLHPILDLHGILRVGGRGNQSNLPYRTRNPVILPGSHPVTKLLVRTEHIRLLHAGPTLVAASLSRRFYIVGARKHVRSITRACVPCRRTSVKPKPQLLGQLPVDRLTPGIVFERTGVDYAGPLLIKTGSIRKPTYVKAYVCVFVSLSVKAIHLELVSDLTSEAFIAAFRRFIARRGKPSTMWSDNGSNFVGASRELKNLYEFLRKPDTQQTISDFCTSQTIRWKFIPEHAPHFGGLWEAAVRCMKKHMRKLVGDAKLSFEELTTVLTQIEACLNSRPLAPLPDSDDGLEAITPGHFLIGRPLEALPDPTLSYQPNSLLRRWRLCQALTRSFWQRWSTDYIRELMKYTKWNHPTRNLEPGDLVCVHEDGLVATKWPLARVVQTYPGADGKVRVVTVRTSRGLYKRPVTKIALILPNT